MRISDWSSDVCSSDLLRLEREKLVAGLRRLQSTARRLAGADERVDRRAGAVDIADHARLHAQRIFKRPDAVFPARIGIGDHLGMVAGERTALVAALSRLLDALHIIGDALGLCSSERRVGKERVSTCRSRA